MTADKRVEKKLSRDSCIVLISGGIDSATTAYWALSQGYSVQGIFFDYEHLTRQREFTCVGNIVDALDIPLHVLKVPLTQQFFIDARPFSGPKGHHEEPKDELRSDVVMCLIHWLTFAASFAIHLNIEEILVGITASDFARAPALHPEILDVFGELVSRWAQRKILVTAPFISKTKSEVVRLGFSLGVPFAKTWSCIEENLLPCGECLECLMRRDAFSSAEIEDPIYRTGQI